LLKSMGCRGLRHDGYDEARRDKYRMNEAAKRAGLPTVRQKLCRTREEAASFATRELGLGGDGERCVVKPYRGCGSDNVFSCRTTADIENAFDVIQNSPVFASTSQEEKTGQSVLVQEYAQGVEYVIDIVSKNGEHKVAAVWKYDKRPANKAPVVYYKTEMVDLEDMEEDHHSQHVKTACDYAFKALDALGLKWGLTHNEVMVDQNNSAKLIEVNCRQHNIDLVPLTSICLGYNAFDMLLAAYFGDDDQPTEDDDPMKLHWDALPIYPTRRNYGAVVHLVCYQKGTVQKVHHLQEIENMPSVVAMEVYEAFTEGHDVSPTIDIRTDAGWVHLVHHDHDQFQRDYLRILQCMRDMFQVETNVPT